MNLLIILCAHAHLFCIIFFLVSECFWALELRNLLIFLAYCGFFSLICSLFYKPVSLCSFIKGSPLVFQIHWALQGSEKCRCLDPVSEAPTICPVPSRKQRFESGHHDLDNYRHTLTTDVFCTVQCSQTADSWLGGCTDLCQCCCIALEGEKRTEENNFSPVSGLIMDNETCRTRGNYISTVFWFIFVVGRDKHSTEESDVPPALWFDVKDDEDGATEEHFGGGQWAADLSPSQARLSGVNSVMSGMRRWQFVCHPGLDTKGCL